MAKVPKRVQARRKEQRQMAKALFHRSRRHPQGMMETPEERMKLISVLRHSTKDNMRRLVDMAMRTEPEFRNRSLVSLAVATDISLKELVREYSAIRCAQGVLEAADAIPGILRDTARRARTHKVECSECLGTGIMFDRKHKEKECPACRGSGVKTAPPNEKALDLMFTTYGLIPKGNTGISLNQNFDMRAEDLGDLSSNVSKILEGTVVKPDASSDPDNES
jgi:hypothetical protein